MREGREPRAGKDCERGEQVRSQGRGDVGLIRGRRVEGVSSHSAEVRSSRCGGRRSGLRRRRRDSRLLERELRRRNRQGEIGLLNFFVLVFVRVETDSVERRRPRQKRKHIIRLIFVHHAVFALGFPPLLPPRLLFSRRLLPTRRRRRVLVLFVPSLAGSIALIFHVETDESTPQRSGGILDVDDGGREVLDPGG